MINKNLACKPEVLEAFKTLIKTEEKQFASGRFRSKELISRIKNANKILVDEFPFIGMHDPWTGEILEDYDYYHTWLDDIEPGWKKTFGLDLCIELKEALLKDNSLDKFQFMQIKEKFGGLRLYSSGYEENTKNALTKYEELSYYICGHCGRQATKVSTGWIYPFCDKCAERINGKTEKIENFYNMLEPTVEETINRIVYNFKYEDFWKPIK